MTVLRQGWWRVGTIVAAGIGMGACDSLAPERDEARVVVSALGGASQVSLITSTDFDVGGGEVFLAEADTQVAAVPLDDVFPLDGEQRFMVSVGPGVEGDTATLRMEVWIDGQSWFNDARTLGVDSTTYMTFVYRLRQPRF
ncbi:MAG TPA: hypothetical protein VK858_01475 [Longimicrobiales bacterium]|nr:hypothetical protein [Longimicrobiales bacterium]